MKNITDSPERAGFIADIFSPEQIVQTCGCGSRYAVHAMETVTARITLFNHTGETKKVVPWFSAAETIRTIAPHSALASYLNNHMVSHRHNRFEFRPDLPEEFIRRMKIEEQIFELKDEENWLLGSMHGTVAQNYGFCGPNWIDQAGKHMDAGRRAFGQRYRKDSSRLLNYKVYCLLDAGRYHSAAQILACYLNMADSFFNNAGWHKKVLKNATNQIFSGERDGAFQLACTLRFLADTGATLSESDIRQVLLAVCQNQGHPWQLTAFNAARLAFKQKHTELAEELANISLEICMKGNITMWIMGLLPISLMHAHEMMHHSATGTARDIMSIASDKTAVHAPHFQGLAQSATLDEMLQMIAITPERWFPFSYR